jgi:hypothetical protein
MISLLKTRICHSSDLSPYGFEVKNMAALNGKGDLFILKKPEQSL